MTKILSLDGGGILGLIQARILSHLEALSGKPLYQMFDLIAGTSTGAILTCCAAIGMPMAQAEQFYISDGPEIFKSRLFGATAELFEAKYGGDVIESCLQARLGLTMLSEAKVPIIAPAFDLAGPHDVVYSSVAAKRDPSRDLPLWKVARASSAAPTYFPPFGTMVDGGVFANNPAICAIAEMSRYGIAHEDIRLLSIGTGKKTEPIKPKDGGLLGWAPHIASVFMQSGADAISFEAHSILGDRYNRIDPPLLNCSVAIDDASSAHVAAMLAVAEKAAAEFRDVLCAWAKL